MQIRRFSADLKSRIPGGHPGLYGVPIVLPQTRLPSDPERLAAFTERVHGLPLALDEPLMVEVMYFEPHATLDEHSADHPIVFLVTAGAGHVRLGGPQGETRQVGPGDAVLWPANVDHLVWTDGEPLEAIVVQLAR